MNRRDYLDTEVRKLMEKKEPSVSDLEKQNELLDQWAMLQWQRQAVLQPKPGSGVPGAPTNWYSGRPEPHTCIEYRVCGNSVVYRIALIFRGSKFSRIAALKEFVE